MGRRHKSARKFNIKKQTQLSKIQPFELLNTSKIHNMILITWSPVQLDNEYLLQCAERPHHFMIATWIVPHSCQFTMLVVGKSYLLPILSILIDLLEAHFLNLSPARLELSCSLVCPNTTTIAIFSGYSKSQIDMNTDITVLITNSTSTIFGTMKSLFQLLSLGVSFYRIWNQDLLHDASHLNVWNIEDLPQWC